MLLQVLDVGSGSGYLTVIFAYLVRTAAADQPTGKVIGIDVIPELIERSQHAARQIPFAAKLLQSNALQLHTVG